MLQTFLTAVDTPSDGALFEDIYETYRGKMFAVAFGVLGNVHDSEDAVQDAFFGIADNFGTVKTLEGPRLKAYLYRAAKNRAMDIARKRGRRELPEPELTQIPEAADDRRLEELISRSTVEKIRDCISELGETYRDVIYMRFVLELKPARIARALGLKKETVKKRLDRGRALLVRALEKEGITYDKK